MAQAYAVIGAGYGDEGKGGTVDAIVAGLGGRAVVVRTNGGAQAGHTVVAPDGTRHVFHHFGSGALAGARTHLSRFFVHHPIMFAQERGALLAVGGNVDVSADPRGYVTTPWDMMVNQSVETARGGGRHGSCGHGFGETVGRNEETAWGLSVADLDRADLPDRLMAIRDAWLPARLASLGVAPDGTMRRMMGSDAVLDVFLSDCRRFRASCALKPDAGLAAGPQVVFEGAQGLMLDQSHSGFPHVTRSSTGLPNMAAVAAEAGIGSIDAFYATRCYLTRHGSGPMPDERDVSSDFDVVDATNVANPWQGSIRFGLLDADLFARTVREDLGRAGLVAVSPHLSVSCLDQVRTGTVPFLAGGRIRRLRPNAFSAMLGETIGAGIVRASFAPGRGAPAARPRLAA